MLLRPPKLSIFIVFLFVCFCLGYFEERFGNIKSDFLFLMCQNEKYSNITLSQHLMFPSWAWGKSKWPLCEHVLSCFCFFYHGFDLKDCMYVINMSFYPLIPKNNPSPLATGGQSLASVVWLGCEFWVFKLCPALQRQGWAGGKVRNSTGMRSVSLNACFFCVLNFKFNFCVISVLNMISCLNYRRHVNCYLHIKWEQLFFLGHNCLTFVKYL